MSPLDVLRTVRDALEAGYDPGYWSPGGPQDGDSEPPSFSSKRAVDFLDRIIASEAAKEAS